MLIFLRDFLSKILNQILSTLPFRVLPQCIVQIRFVIPTNIHFNRTIYMKTITNNTQFHKYPLYLNMKRHTCH